MVSPKVTDAELAVLEALWAEGPQTIRQVTAAVYPQQSASDYATVQKLLDRLEAKACVVRDRSALAHVFRPAVQREAVLDDQLQEVADRLCEGSLVPMLHQLVRKVKLSKAERNELRKLLEDDQRRREAK